MRIWALLFLIPFIAKPSLAETYPRLAGSYQPATSSPRVFDTPDDLRSMVERIKSPGSFSATMWAKLSRQAKADVAAPVDWDATYSGCDIDIYLHSFSVESSGGYAQEQRGAAELNAALHVRSGMKAPAGAAPVAARLAMYAALVKNGAPALPGSPTGDEAANLSRRILLAWAAHGLRDAPDRYKQKPMEFCEAGKRDIITQSGVGLQIGRGVLYTVQAQDLLMGLHALSSEETRTLNAFHSAMWTLIRYSSNFAAEPEFRKPDRICEIYSNHRAMHLLALLAIARLLNNQKWFEQTLYGGLEGVPPISIPWAEYFDHAIYGEHDKPIACYANPGKDSLTSKPSFQTSTVAPGEIEDRYRHANPDQGIGYPMFTLEDLYFDGLVLKNAGFDLFAYQGRHGQSLQVATDYYACLAKSAGFGKPVTAANAQACPNAAQYIGQNVNDVEKDLLMGASRFPHDAVLDGLVPDAEARPDGRALDAIVFGHWPE
jgi:hypothetical protein